MKRLALFVLLCSVGLTACSGGAGEAGSSDDPGAGSNWDEMKWDQGKWG